MCRAFPSREGGALAISGDLFQEGTEHDSRGSHGHGWDAV